MIFNAGAPAYILTGDGIALNGNILNNGTNHVQTIAIDMTLDSVRKVIGTNTARTVLSGNISGAGGFRFEQIGSGVPAITLSGNSSYSGSTVVYMNTDLTVTSPQALGNTSNLEINSAFFHNNSGVDLTVNSITGGNALSLYLPHRLVTDTVNVGSGSADFRVYEGTLSISNLNGSAIVMKSKDGTLIIRGSSPNYSGKFSMVGVGGVLVLAAKDSIGIGTSVMNFTGYLEATSDLSGSNKLPIDLICVHNKYGFGGANNIEIDGDLTLTEKSYREHYFTNYIVSGKTLTVGNIIGNSTNLIGDYREIFFTGDGNTVVNGAISESTKPVRVKKFGDGSLTILGASTYTGSTSVEAGTLLVNGAHTVGGAYTVKAGASLGGTGSITNAVSIPATAHLVPGGDGVVGDFAIGPLTLKEDAVLDWDHANNATDSVSVTGDVNLPTVLVVNVNRLNINGHFDANTVLLRWTGVNTGATDISTWVINSDDAMKLTYDGPGKQVLITGPPPTGTVISIR